MKESKPAAAAALHSSPSAISMMSPRRESRGIDKTSSGTAAAAYGAIRVIHIFAPKVIKTDVANFRALVQKLTGRQSSSSSSQDGKSTRRRSRHTAAAAGASSSEAPAGRLRPSSRSTTTSMRSPTSTSISSSVENSSFEFESSSSVNTSTANRHQSSSSAAIADFEFETRSSPLNSQGSASLFSAPDSSMTSSTTAAAAKLNWFEMEFSGRIHSSPSSSSSFVSEPLRRDQMLSANVIEAAAAEDRLMSTSATAKSSSCSSWNESGRPAGSKSSSIMVDPMQSLSGYKDNVSCSWSSPEASSCNSLSQEQEDTDFHQLQHRYQRNDCNNVAATLSSGHRTTSSNELSFSEMEILAGLVSPGHHPPVYVPEVNSLPPPPPLMTDYTCSNNNNNNSFSLEHFFFPSHHHHHHHQPSGSCRLSVHPLFRETVPSEHF